jgi:aromatic-L-amino-acid/L-tryptophan decarboxylase
VAIQVNEVGTAMTGSAASGKVLQSNDIVHGRFAIRSCIVKFRTEAEEELVEEAVTRGRLLDAQLRPEMVL